MSKVDVKVAELKAQQITTAERTKWNSAQLLKLTQDNGSAINISNTDLNNIDKVGFYYGENLENSPTGAGSGNWYIIEVYGAHPWMVQIAHSYFSNTFYMRRLAGGTWQPWTADLFQSVSDGKINVRNAITGKGASVADADGDGYPTFAELVNGINSIPVGKSFYEGTLTSSMDKHDFPTPNGSMLSYYVVVPALGFTPRTISCISPGITIGGGFWNEDYGSTVDYAVSGDVNNGLVYMRPEFFADGRIRMPFPFYYTSAVVRAYGR